MVTNTENFIVCSDVYWKGSVTGGGVASVLGIAGALAVAAPALYIAYQSSSTGQSASSIAKVRSFIDIHIIYVKVFALINLLQKYLRSIMSGADYEYDYDYGNIDLTKRYKHILLFKCILMLNTFISDNTFF